MDPVNLLGIIFVVIGIVLWIVLGIRLFFSYQRTEKKQTMYLSLLLIFGGFGMLSLLVEQVILIAAADPAEIPPFMSILEYQETNIFWLGFIAASLAWITSALGIIWANFFTHSFFPDANKRILIIPIGLIAIYLVLIITSPFQWVVSGTDWSPEHAPDAYAVILSLFFIPLWTVAILFLYLTISLKRKGTTAWRRLFWIFITQTLLSIGFTVEILNPAFFTSLLSLPSSYDGIISAMSRFLLMIYPILMWIGVFTPNWAKSKLGVSN